MMINASNSRSTRMRQYRCQMKKTKVFSGFTNQLKEVLGRLERVEEGGVRTMREPWASRTALFKRWPDPSTHSLGPLQGLGLLPPLPHWPFLRLFHSQQLKLCLHLPLEKGGTEAELLGGSALTPQSLAWPHPP